MTPAEYRAIRLAAGLTQASLAKLLDVRSNTIARRERGERPISRETALALEALIAREFQTTDNKGE